MARRPEVEKATRILRRFPSPKPPGEQMGISRPETWSLAGLSPIEGVMSGARFAALIARMAETVREVMKLSAVVS
jgi:hypothetical protein